MRIRRAALLSCALSALLLLLVAGWSLRERGSTAPPPTGPPAAEEIVTAPEAVAAVEGNETPPASPPPSEPAPPPVPAPPVPARVARAPVAGEPRPGEDKVIAGRIVDPVTGKPIAGAKVSLGMLAKDEERHEVLTDANGRFRLEGLRREVFDYLRVEAAGYVKRSTLLHEGSDDVTVSLAPSSRIYGKVTDPEGRPVPGALVFVAGVYGRDYLDWSPGYRLSMLQRMRGRGDQGVEFERWMKGRAAAVADAAGRYDAGDLPVAQALALVAWGDGFSASEPRRDFVIPPGSAGEPLDLVLRPDTHLVLRITVPGGMDPPAEVTAAASTPFWPKPFRRSEDGTWMVSGLPAGRTWYLVEAPPYAAVYESAELEPGKRTEVDILLGQGDGISGRVVDAERRGVEGLSIRVSATARGAREIDLNSGTVTDSAGRFAVRGLKDGEYAVSVVDKEALFDMDHGKRKAPCSDLELPAPGSLRFRLVAPTDSPLPEPERFTVSASPEGDKYLDEAWWDRNLTYDRETGIVDVRRTYPGKTTLAVKVPDFIEVRRTMAVPAGGATDFGDVVLVPAIRARGRVLDPEGKPVPNAEVTAWYKDGVSSTAKSDLAGAFELRDLAPGDATIEVYDAGNGGEKFALTTWKWRFFEGMPPIEVSLKAGGLVRVRVLDPKGLPVAVAHVSCDPPKSKYRPVPRSLDPAEEPGEFTGRRLPGPMVVQVLDPARPGWGKPLATAQVDVREGKEAFVEIRLPK